MQTIESEIKILIAKTLAVDTEELDDDIGPGDIPQWDSLGNQSVLAAVEEKYGFAFNINEVLDMETLGDLIDTVTKRVG